MQDIGLEYSFDTRQAFASPIVQPVCLAVRRRNTPGVQPEPAGNVHRALDMKILRGDEHRPNAKLLACAVDRVIGAVAGLIDQDVAAGNTALQKIVEHPCCFIVFSGCAVAADQYFGGFARIVQIDRRVEPVGKRGRGLAAGIDTGAQYQNGVTDRCAAVVCQHIGTCYGRYIQIADDGRKASQKNQSAGGP